MTLKKWAHHWKANKILHKKLLSKISLLKWSSKWVKFYLFFIKLIKIFLKNIFYPLKINLNFTWKYFLMENFIPWWLFQWYAHFFKVTFRSKVIWENVLSSKKLCDTECFLLRRKVYVILCDINIFLRVKKWFPSKKLFKND